MKQQWGCGMRYLKERQATRCDKQQGKIVRREHKARWQSSKAKQQGAITEQQGATLRVARCNNERQSNKTESTRQRWRVAFQQGMMANNKAEQQGKAKKIKTLNRIKMHNTHETKLFYAKFQGLQERATGMQQLQPSLNFSWWLNPETLTWVKGSDLTQFSAFVFFKKLVLTVKIQ